MWPRSFNEIEDILLEMHLRYHIPDFKAWNTIKKSFGVLQRRFRCLTHPVSNSLSTVKVTICSAAILHNMTAKCRDLYGFPNDKEEVTENIDGDLDALILAFSVVCDNWDDVK